jgi:hypothetical protein
MTGQPGRARVVRPAELQPGDILLTRFDAGLFARLIRFGAALKELITGKPNPNVHNHVIIVWKTDDAGVLWGIEARAEGVGPVDLAKRIENRWVISNADQPKTPEQRAVVVATVEAMLGSRYDWVAIVADAMQSLGINEFWQTFDWAPDGKGHLPYATVCSALADLGYRRGDLVCPSKPKRVTAGTLVGHAYEVAGLPAPGGRFVTPADWETLITQKAWEIA